MPFERLWKYIAFPAAVLLAVLLLSLTAAAQIEEKGPGVKVIAALYSTLGTQKDVQGWVGNAIFLIGDQGPIAATYFCPLGPVTLKKNGAINAVETCYYTLPDGAFEVLNRATGLPDSAPGLYTMHTISTIVKGTGRYHGASGELIERAQFIFADFPVPLPALGRTEGVIFGIQ